MIGSKLFYLTIFALVCVSFCVELKPRGAPRELSGDELKTAIDKLHAALAKLATGDGPSYEAAEVTKVTTKVVAGTLDSYTVQLNYGDVSKQCVVDIWSRPWLDENGTNIKIKCDGDDSSVDSTW